MMQTKREEQIAEIRQRTGIDETLIRDLVFEFYRRIRQDAVLAPVFEERISDWDTHLERMCAFWSSVALMSGHYSGQPMQRHQSLPVTGAHFDRWLSLFETTAEDLCTPPAAAHFIERARRIAESLELGVAAHKGVMLKRGERLS